MFLLVGTVAAVFVADLTSIVHWRCILPRISQRPALK